MKSFKLDKQILKSGRISEEQVIGLFERLVKDAWSNKTDKTFFTSQKNQKPLGSRLFEAIARLSVNVGFEAVNLRKNKQSGEIEVFMLRRGPRESFPGQWHVPGSIFRPGEQPKDVARRLAEKEFGCKLKSDFKCRDMVFVSEKRGWFLSLVYLVTCQGRLSAKGKWWPVSALPKNTVWLHKKFIIPAAVRAFQSLARGI